MAVRLKASARTSAEDLLALMLNANGLLFQRQWPYAPPRKLAADFIVTANGESLLVEIQGGVYSRQAHGSVSGVLADIDRLNAATLAGYRLLRFTPQQVESGEALNVIQQALGVRS